MHCPAQNAKLLAKLYAKPNPKSTTQYFARDREFRNFLHFHVHLSRSFASARHTTWTNHEATDLWDPFLFLFCFFFVPFNFASSFFPLTLLSVCTNLLHFCFVIWWMYAKFWMIDNRVLLNFNISEDFYFLHKLVNQTS